MNLRDALEMDEHEVVAIVGGGGKTTILYRLARETVETGGKAVVTGTTRFTPPEAAELPPAVLCESTVELLAGLRSVLAQFPLVVAGSGWGNQGRIMPVEPEAVAAMAAIEGVGAVVAEADGSAGRPFKAPAEHEPAVAPSTTLLLTVAGMDVLGRPLDADHVHRPEIVAGLSGVPLGSPVTEEMVARVLLDERGGRKGRPAGSRWLPVLNKVDDPLRLEAARRIGRLLLDGGADRVILATAGRKPPVVEVIE
jgi:molybdenum cofactor cytidylyltransferase